MTTTNKEITDPLKKSKFYQARNGFIDGTKYIEAVGPRVFVHLVDGRKVEEPALKVGFIEERVRANLWTEHDTPPDGTLVELVDRVELWSIQKGIHGSSTPEKQFKKLEEEVEELGDEIHVEGEGRDIEAIKDEAGDVAVTLIVTCQLLGIPLLQCLRKSVQKIEARSGKMVDGVFCRDDKVVQGDFTPDE